MTLDHVRRIAQLGLNVLPLLPRSKKPDWRVLPDGEWKRYQTEPVTDLELCKWFGDGENRNAAIICTRVAVVESDTPEAEAWCVAHLPYTPMMTRSARGFHRYFLRPTALPEIPASIKVGNLEIEVKRDGQYVVAPGSIHPGDPDANIPPGHVYCEVEPWPTTLDALPVLPMDVIADAGKGIGAHRAQTVKPLPRTIGLNTRNNTLFREAARLRRLGWERPEIEQALAGVNVHRCDPPLEPSEIAEIAESVLRYRPAVDLNSLILDPNDPLPSARAFVGQHYTIDGVLTLRHQNGVFYRYEASAYTEHDQAAVRGEVYRFVEPAHTPKGQKFQPTKAKVENFLDALRADANLPIAQAPPIWLDGRRDLDPSEILACRNGLLHIPTRTLLPPTPLFYTLNGLDFGFNPQASPPANWFAFTRQLWPNDTESIETLREWFGYTLTPDTSQQKALLVIGPKRSGKGTIARILRRVVGVRNVCGPTLANMSEQFGRATLIGKSVAIIADARISGRSDTAVITEQLLSITGEDTQTVPRKFLPDWTGKLSTRFVLLTNELPRIEDSSGALASRFLVLALSESFYGKEDHGLFDRLVAELDGILLWALEGRDRLYARGHFVQPKSAKALIEQFEDLGSPIGAFLREQCEIDRGYRVKQSDLFLAWQLWCGENGRTHPGTIQMFGRNLRAAIPWLGESRPVENGERVRYFEGVRLQQGPRPTHLPYG